MGVSYVLDVPNTLRTVNTFTFNSGKDNHRFWCSLFNIQLCYRQATLKTGSVLSVNGCVCGLSGSVPGVLSALLQYGNEANISPSPTAVISS